MILLPVILLVLMGGYFIYSGLIDKPPFEDLQSGEGWHNSKFPNKYWAIAIGISFIASALWLLI